MECVCFDVEELVWWEMGRRSWGDELLEWDVGILVVSFYRWKLWVLIRVCGGCVGGFWEWLRVGLWEDSVGGWGGEFGGSVDVFCLFLVVLGVWWLSFIERFLDNIFDFEFEEEIVKGK